MKDDEKNLSPESNTPKIIRGALQVVGGAVPFVGGLFSAAAGAWNVWGPEFMWRPVWVSVSNHICRPDF